MLHDMMIYWLVLGFVLAVLGDLIQMFRKVPLDERFLLGDTAFVTVAWPLVLYLAYLEVRKAAKNG